MSRRISVKWRGRIVDVELVPIDDRGHELEAAAAVAWRQMRLAAELEGVTLAAKTAFRSYEYQRLLRQKYDDYQSYMAAYRAWRDSGKVGNEPPRVPYAALAAQPGSSHHEIGKAVDVAGAAVIGSPIETWVGANCERFGFKRDVPGESWHLHFLG